MYGLSNRLGFSLIEILVSLFIVSLTAVNISGLQKMVGDQSRDNLSHAIVVGLATEKFEEVMQTQILQEIIDLNGTTTTYFIEGTQFKLAWEVDIVSDASVNSSVRELTLKITWSDATGKAQLFSYSEHISLVMLLKGGGGSSEKNYSYVIPNLLEANDVDYFESQFDYKMDAYVIYNSQLFQATSNHLLNHVEQSRIDPPINIEGAISSGWELFGRIDDEALADLFSE